MRSTVSRISRFLFPLLLAVLLLAALPVPVAHANGTSCDGTVNPDNITCSSDPTVPDTDIYLDNGDDILLVEEGVTTGTVSGGRGDDTITFNGDADAHSTSHIYGDDADGDGGNDTIIINGYVNHLVAGDYSSGDGGDDTIVVNGYVNGYVWGDYLTTSGGNDTITINGFAVGVAGDGGSGVGGDDTITVNGEVGDKVKAEEGDDTVILGVDAIVGSTIDGGDGSDTLKFKALTQAQVNALGLDPAGDTTTVNGHTYTWLNFESLLGLLAELVEQAGRSLHVYLASDSLLAIESNDGDGISVFAEHGRIAFVSFSNVAMLAEGEQATYSTPNSAGWYVTVVNLGADPDHAGHTLYQVSIYDVGSALISQFTFSN